MNSNTSIKRAALLVACTSSFLIPFVSSSVNIALPTIGIEFGSNALILAWMSTAYLLAAVTCLIPFGRIADIFGRKRLLIIGMSIYSLASLACTLAPSDKLLIAFRCMQGAGAAIFFGPSLAILTSVFPKSERGKAMGISVAFVYLGLSLGPWLGGVMTKHIGWRSIFVFNVASGLFVVLLVLWKLKGEWADAKGERLDVAGALIYGVSLVATLMGFSNLTKNYGPWLFAAGLLGLLSFLVWETKSGSPLFNVSLLLRNRTFAFSNAAALINYMATFATTFLMSLYLQQVRGMDPGDAGKIMLVQAAMQALFSPLAGRLSDRIEPRVVSSFGMALTTFGLVLLAYLEAESATGFIILALALVGTGYGTFSSPNTNAVMSSVDKKYYGIASASVSTARMVGMTFSMGLVMLFLSINIGDAAVTVENQAGFVRAMRFSFSLCAALCAVGVFASLSRGKVHGSQPLPQQ